MKLPSAEYSAISSWKGSAIGIRKAISEGDLSGEHGHAGNFLKAIAKCPIYTGILFRGIHGDYAKAVRDTLIKNGVGGTWQDDAPMGCSRNTNTPVTGAGSADHSGASKVVKNAERLKAGQADAEEAMSTVVLINPDGNVTHIGKYVRRDSDSIPTLAIA